MEEDSGDCRERINESVFRQSNRDIGYKKFLHGFQLFFFVSEKSKKVIFWRAIKRCQTEC